MSDLRKEDIASFSAPEESSTLKNGSLSRICSAWMREVFSFWREPVPLSIEDRGALIAAELLLAGP